jgi:hypothetical protein
MRHLMRDAMRAAALPDDCTLHGLRYTFATRAIERSVHCCDGGGKPSLCLKRSIRYLPKRGLSKDEATSQ